MNDFLPVLDRKVGRNPISVLFLGKKTWIPAVSLDEIGMLWETGEQ